MRRKNLLDSKIGMQVILNECGASIELVQQTRRVPSEAVQLTFIEFIGVGRVLKQLAEYELLKFFDLSS